MNLKKKKSILFSQVKQRKLWPQGKIHCIWSYKKLLEQQCGSTRQHHNSKDKLKFFYVSCLFFFLYNYIYNFVVYSMWFSLSKVMSIFNYKRVLNSLTWLESWNIQPISHIHPTVHTWNIVSQISLNTSMEEKAGVNIMWNGEVKVIWR